MRLAKQLDGWRLTTAEILYHLPDHPAVLQSYVALIGFRGGEAGTEKLGCGHLVREQKWE